MRPRHTITTLLTLALLAGACGGTTSPPTTEALNPGAGASPTTEAATTTSTIAAPAGDTSTTSAAPTTTVFDRFVDLLPEPPPFEEITITTEDDVELYAKYWERDSDIAVIFGHDFDALPGGSVPRPPQSSDTVIPWTGVIADQGYTVLSLDFRGHGQSAGEYSVKESLIDLKAVYEWLTDAGYSSIVMMGWVGSGTAATVLDATDEEVNFTGLVLLFSPLQDTGLDAQRMISDLDIPTYFIGINTGTTARSAKFLEQAAVNSLGITIFDAVPSGLQFTDVHGAEMAGRLLQFLDDVSA